MVKTMNAYSSEWRSDLNCIKIGSDMKVKQRSGSMPLTTSKNVFLF